MFGWQQFWGEAKLQLVDFGVTDPMVGEKAMYRFLIENECWRRWLLLLLSALEA